MLDHDQPESFALDRQHMVALQLRARGIRDERVLDAMARIPREEFVPQQFRHQAYGDHPIPIGQGQTISQPYIVALMLEALAIQPTDKVLEIGTGSGYLTAVLAELSSHVYSIERHSSLAQTAERVLAALGYRNINIVVGDGSKGLPAHAPYDAIIVSAAAPELPLAMVEQLRDGGRMIIPVGSTQSQELLLVRKQQDETVLKHLEGCRFVPLIGREDPAGE